MADFSKETINIGTSANDGTGDTIRVSFRKTNNNFTELYDHAANLSANVESLQTDLENYVGDLVQLNGVAYDTANDAYELANDLILISQTAIIIANAASDRSNDSYTLANAAYDYANSQYTVTVLTRNKLNAAYTVANAAFDKANTVDITNQNLADLEEIVLEHVFPRSNDAYDLSIQVYDFALGVAVNAAAGFGRTNTVYGYLNAAFSKINSAYTVLNASYTSVNAAYVVANSGYTTGNGAFRVANAAFAKANAALPNTDGSIFNGRLFTANTLFGGTLQISANGVYGTSNNWHGGYFTSANNAGLRAEGLGNNDAIITQSQKGNGVFGVANTGNGVVGFSDTGYGGYFYSANGIPLGSGALKRADDGTYQILDALIVDANGIVSFDSGYGYPSPAYGCRAWVNFDGTSLAASLTNLPFTANATTKLIRVTLTDPANNDIVVDSTVYLQGVGNGTRRRHSDGANFIFACWLGLGCRYDIHARTYKVKTVNQSEGWFECDYPDSYGYVGYWYWFYWWWWWYYRYGWYVPTGHTYTGTCNILRSKIRGSGGVSSVNDLGSGRYQINFDFEMPDTNYAITGTASNPEYFQYDWRGSCSLGIRSQHTTFCEVSANHHWGGVLFGWWWWWWWYYPWNGPGTYPARHMHVAIFR